MENKFNRFVEDAMRDKIEGLIDKREDLKVQIAELELDEAKVNKELAGLIHTLNKDRRKYWAERRSKYGKK